MGVLILSGFLFVGTFLIEGFFFKAVWKMAKVLIDKDTQRKIFIESGKGLKTIRKFISDDTRIPNFLGGKSELPLLANPGIASKELKQAICILNLESRDEPNLKKFFWNVDMSKPENWLGNSVSSRNSRK